MKIFKTTNVFIAFFLLMAFAESPAIASEAFTAKVIVVIDGDTIVVLKNNQQVKIRLAGIDCPEKSQPFGSNAKQALSDLIYRKEISFQIVAVDRYQRLVAHLFFNGDNINKKMLANGSCFAYRKHLEDKSFIFLEAKAQKAKLGLWALPEEQRIKPWEWRKLKK